MFNLASRSPNFHRQARWAWRPLPIRDVDGKPDSAWEASVRPLGCYRTELVGLRKIAAGLRNSLLVASILTSSTSQILGGVRWWTASGPGTDAELGISLTTGTPAHCMYCVWCRVTYFISFIPILHFSVTSTTPFLLLCVTCTYIRHLEYRPLSVVFTLPTSLCVSRGIKRKYILQVSWSARLMSVPVVINPIPP